MHVFSMNIVGSDIYIVLGSRAGCDIFGILRLPTRPSDERPPVI